MQDHARDTRRHDGLALAEMHGGELGRWGFPNGLGLRWFFYGIGLVLLLDRLVLSGAWFTACVRLYFLFH